MARFAPKYGYYGKGIFHITLTVTDRQPILGTLIVPDGQIEEAYVQQSALGENVIECLRAISQKYPQIEPYAYELMPDHLHVLLHVGDVLPQGHSLKRIFHFFRIECNKAALLMGWNSPFTEPVYITLCSRKGQLQTLFEYVHQNPRRLALKRSMPDYFRTMRGIDIEGTTYDAVGNIGILLKEKRQTIHVHKELVWMAERDKNDTPLRNYMNGCVLAAREGAVSVSPFISPHERQVLDVLLKEKHPIIYIRDNGFSQYFKPSGNLIEACAEGRLLLLSPSAYQEEKGAISRAECQALNALADSIALAAC